MKRLYIIVVFFMMHCGGEKTIDPLLPRYGSELRISYLASLENLDPQKMIFKDDVQVSSLIYEGLVRFKSNVNDVEPAIAQNWQKSNKGSTIRLTLRDSVYFHENICFTDKPSRLLTVDDVIYTFHRLCDPAMDSPFHTLFSSKIKGSDKYISSESESISGIKKIDDKTIEFQLNKPYVSFIKLLAAPAAFIVSEKAIRYYGDKYQKNPVGTGPFRIAVWKPLESLTLIRNNHYWEKDHYGSHLPYINSVKIKLLSNPALKISQFQAGDLDIITVSGNQYYDLIAAKDSTLDIQMAQTTPSLTIRFWGFSLDSDHPVCNNTALRIKIAKAMNRPWMPIIKKDPSLMAHTLLPQSLLPHGAFEWHPYDIVPVQTVFLNKLKPLRISTNIQSEDVELILAAFDTLKIPYIFNHQSVNYYRDIFHSRPELFRVSFLPSFPDIEEYYHLFYSRASIYTNITQYKNPEYDSIYEQLVITADPEKRNILIKRMESILKNDVPALYLSHPSLDYHLTTERVKAFEMRYNGYFLNYTWIKNNEIKTD